MGYILAGIGIIVGVICIMVGAELAGIVIELIVLLGGGASAIAKK